MKNRTSATRTPTVLFVCTGNICRSPMAEGLLRTRLTREGLADRIQVRSSGTHGIDGSPASTYAIVALHQMGIDIRGHRARTVTQQAIDDADLLLVMTHRHITFIERHFRRTKGKLYLLNEMIGQDFDVDDPYGGPETEYAHCAHQLSNTVDQGLQTILGLLPSFTAASASYPRIPR
ncbi:MAG: low molecular weight protein arginine phosphatase [Chloroflexota bacterium]